MANAAYDFKPGRFFLVEITDEGPNRLQGHTTYDSQDVAEKAALEMMRANMCRKQIVALVKVAGLHMLDVKTSLIDVRPPNHNARPTSPEALCSP